MQRTGRPQPEGRGSSLCRYGEDMHERGGYSHTTEHSLHAQAIRRKALTATVVAVAAVYGLLRANASR